MISVLVPAAYLDPLVRECISTFSKMAADDMDRELARLHTDLESGVWASRHAALDDLDVLDVGYRLVVGRPSSQDSTRPAIDRT
jgi:hypothetical protein